MDGIGHKICGVLGVGICEGGDIQFYASVAACKEAAVVIAFAHAADDRPVDVFGVLLIILRNSSAQKSSQS